MEVVEVLPVFAIITSSLGLLGLVVGQAKLSNCLTRSFTLVGWFSLANNLQWVTIIDLLGFTGGVQVGTDLNTELTPFSCLAWP